MIDSNANSTISTIRNQLSSNVEGAKRPITNSISDNIIKMKVRDIRNASLNEAAFAKYSRRAFMTITMLLTQTLKLA